MKQLILSGSEYLLAFFIALSFSGCADEDTVSGELSLHFSHHIDGQPAVYNSMQYQNAAGNLYEVTEIQWFISDVMLLTGNGNGAIIQTPFAHYVDTNIPETLTWDIVGEIPVDTYKFLRFTFGLKGDKNVPGQFPEFPENNMVWPYNLGGDQGGYHYMKLNGFWMNPANLTTPFNFHLGVGQLYNEADQVTAFVQNWFEVTVPVNVVVQENQTASLELIMDVDSWFESPHLYDHNVFGSMIMKNQEAMGIIRANGFDVFSIRSSE